MPDSPSVVPALLAPSGAGAEPRREFLGWDRPWSTLFAGWLAAEPEKLRRRLVVVPTREAGRRLRESLLAVLGGGGAAAMLGPRLAMPEDFFRPAEQIPESVRWAGWLRVLEETDDADVAAVFPGGIAVRDREWRLAVGRQIEEARDQLGSGGWDFGALAKKVPEEAPRWRELAALAQRVTALWREWGFVDVVGERWRLTADPVLPPGVDEIVVAGVPDPALLGVLSWQALRRRGVSVTVLMGAPAELAHAFDAWGRPEADHWAERARHRRPGDFRLAVAADAAALAGEVVRSCAGKSNLAVAVAAGDAAFVPVIERAFRAAGWPAFDPEKAPASRDGWAAWFEAVAEFMARSDEFAALARVARHPAAWSGLGADAGPARLVQALDELLLESPSVSSAEALRTLAGAEDPWWRSAAEFLNALQTRLNALGGAEAESLPKQVLGFFPSSDLENANRARAEMRAWPALRAAGFTAPELLRWLGAAMQGISQRPAATDGVLPLQGWLELAHDPAPDVVVAALHEGAVPEAPSGSPLISEAVCERLGLRARRSRLAREAFLFAALVESRRAGGSVTVVNARVDPAGDPCRPSRVLLQVSDDDLPAEVLRHVSDRGLIPAPPTPATSRGGWRLRPPVSPPKAELKRVSASRLRAYLACPTRYYFTEVLGWRDFEPGDGELPATAFGDLIHGVLREWGEDPAARGIAEVETLRADWRRRLAAAVERRLGAEPPALLRLQALSAEERLGALAVHQVEQFQQGWRVEAVELAIEDAFSLAGVPVKVVIDRIDRHLDGRVRVVDYKTGSGDESPAKAHLRVWSAEKCPAALGTLVEHGHLGGAGWSNVQLPLYAEAVRRAWSLEKTPSAWFAWLPPAVGDTGFKEFEGMEELMPVALAWAGEAVRRIRAGVFWPPAPEVAYDRFAALAPEGLQRALGSEWERLLAGGGKGAS
ncbi:MAG: PD-(D/E)XK nuclease family protein [Opitutaceae bacterium]